MKLSEVCIQRPVLSWVMTFVLILVGLVGFSRLPVQQYPNVESVVVTIETQLSGASPEIIETQVTRIIEEAISGIEGVESISSSSGVEISKVSVEFRPDRGMDNAVNEIRDRLSRNRDKLPDDVNEPVIIRSKADERPVIYLAFTSEKMSPSDLYDYAEREIQKDLEAVPGVSRVDLVGAGQYEMVISLNPLQMSGHMVTVLDVISALKRQNVERPAGRLISQSREYLVTTVANLEKTEDFENVIVATRKDHLIRIKDIGNVYINSDDRRTRTRFNGQQGISINISKQSNANPLDVAKAVKTALEREIKPRLPESVSVFIAGDRTRSIEKEINNVYKAIFEAVILVILVVFLFLRSARASIIPVVTIPVSLIGTFFLIYILNFSINIFTLFAFVLAIGLVVDDAIVVLENIYRQIEKGKPPFQAAIKGIREIGFAVIAMTLTLAAVYAPIPFAKGKIGKYFTEFSITLAGAMIISGFVALTLSPMMCARLLGPHQNSNNLSGPKNWWERFKEKIPTDVWLDKLEVLYEKTLIQTLKKRTTTLLVGLIVSFFGYVSYKFLPNEFMPREDSGALMIEGTAPQSATIEFTEKHLAKLDDILATYPEIERRISNIINPTFDISIDLKENRKRSTNQIIDELRKRLEMVTGLDPNIRSIGSGGGSSDNVVEFVVRGNKTYNELRDLAQLITQSLYMSGMVRGVRGQMQSADNEDYTITLNRDKLLSLNVEPATVAETIDALIRGSHAKHFKKENKLYKVKVEVDLESKRTPEDITNLFIRVGEKNPALVPLSELVSVDARSGPIEIYRHNRQRSIYVAAFLKPSYTVGDGIDLVNSLSKDIMPSDVKVDFTGDTKKFLTESQTMGLVFAMALAFIYLVMAAQFESWRDPLIIFFSVPLSLVGGVFALTLIENGTLNAYSFIGFVTLIGLITKHGILMVDFANKLRETGEEKIEAIIKASKLRLRPILMTTFAMVLGAVPLVMELSGNIASGYEKRRQLGWVIIGGMVLGTIFTLFIVPSVYSFLAARKVKKNKLLNVDNAQDNL